MQYKINSALFYKIWFSNNKNVFLPEQNKERFIKFLNNANENQKIYFIYSSKYLNELALMELKEFCENHKIIPIDFEKIISEGDELDQEMHRLASQELELWIEDNGGNPGVASDLLRWSKYVVKQYGVYSDFDVTVKPNLLHDIMIKMPILLPTCQAGLNNDFIAFAYDEGAQDIHADAKMIINKFQEDLKIRLNNLESSLIKSDCLFPKNPIGDQYAGYAEKFIQSKEKVPTIQEFRKYLINLIREGSLGNEEIESTFFQISVITIAGPGALNRLLPIIKDALSIKDSYSDIAIILSVARAVSLTNKYFYIKSNIGDTSWIENGITFVDNKPSQLTIETKENGLKTLDNDLPNGITFVDNKPSQLTIETKENGLKALDNDLPNFSFQTIKACIGIDIGVDAYRAIYNPAKENIYKLFYDIGVLSSINSPSIYSDFLIYPSIANDLLNKRYLSAAYHAFQNAVMHQVAFDSSSGTISLIKLHTVGTAMVVFNTASNVMSLYNQYNDVEYTKVAEKNRESALDALCTFVGNFIEFCWES